MKVIRIKASRNACMLTQRSGLLRPCRRVTHVISQDECALW